MSYRKVGGLHHWRIGRFGGCFYLASRHRRDRRPSIAPIALSMVAWLAPLGAALATIAALAS